MSCFQRAGSNRRAGSLGAARCLAAGGFVGLLLARDDESVAVLHAALSRIPSRDVAVRLLRVLVDDERRLRRGMRLQQILLEARLDEGAALEVLESPLAAASSSPGTDALDASEHGPDDRRLLGILALARRNERDGESDVAARFGCDVHARLEQLDEGRPGRVSGEFLIVLLDFEPRLMRLEGGVESRLDDLGTLAVHHVDGAHDGVEARLVAGIERRFEPLEGNLVDSHLERLDFGTLGIDRDRVSLGIGGGIDLSTRICGRFGHDGLGGLGKIIHND